MCPNNAAVKKLFDRLGAVVALDDFGDAGKISVLGCIMGDFYRHQCEVQEWLVEQGIDGAAATDAVSGFCSTYNHASMQTTR
jgi:hypothetical protein